MPLYNNEDLVNSRASPGSGLTPPVVGAAVAIPSTGANPVDGTANPVVSMPRPVDDMSRPVDNMPPPTFSGVWST